MSKRKRRNVLRWIPLWYFWPMRGQLACLPMDLLTTPKRQSRSKCNNYIKWVQTKQTTQRSENTRRQSGCLEKYLSAEENNRVVLFKSVVLFVLAVVYRWNHCCSHVHPQACARVTLWGKWAGTGVCHLTVDPSGLAYVCQSFKDRFTTPCDTGMKLVAIHSHVLVWPSVDYYRVISKSLFLEEPLMLG